MIELRSVRSDAGALTTCPYCGVGCGVIAGEQKSGFVVAGDTHHPANFGRLCVKGTALAETLTDNNRLLLPELRGQPTTWDTALTTVADAFSEARNAYGSQSIAMYLSGQLLTEDYYVANKLMKGFLGSANVDTNSRLCMASAVAGYKRAFGEDVVPCNYEDIDDCELLLFIGSNAAWTHPVLYQRAVLSKREKPNKRLVVIDVRRTATCDSADDVLLIRPGSDGFLFGGLFMFLVQNGHQDTDWVVNHTVGLDAALASVCELDIATVAQHTGLDEAAVLAFYRQFANSERVLSFYSQGINQSASGTDKCNAIINCHLLTGRIGRPGMGPFSITGQPNAMGGREVGGLANQLAAHMDFRPEDIERVQRFWGATDMATAPGYKAVELFERAADGEIKALWIMATNPLVSLPNSALIKRALERVDFVAVSDCTRRTETAAFADVLLPAEPWGEKDGTVTNSERMISRQRPFRSPQGSALPDWRIIVEVARRMGLGKSFSYKGPAEIFCEHAALSGFENGGTRLFDIGQLSDLDESAYNALQPVQWPFKDCGGPIRPFGDGRFSTHDGRANFVALKPYLPAALVGTASEQTFILNTGRLRDQWHTMTRTGLSPRLAKHRDFMSVWINPLDAHQRGFAEGAPVVIRNECGSFCALLKTDQGVPGGACFAPIHWSGLFSGNAKVSQVMAGITDPISGQPESKVARVSLNAVQVDSWAWVITRQPFFDICSSIDVTYWSTIAVEGGWLTQVADVVTPRDLYKKLLVVSKRAEAAFYEDEREQDYRAVVSADENAEIIVFVASRQNRLLPQPGISSLLSDWSTCDVITWLGGAIGEVQEEGSIVCSCHEVGALSIQRAIRQGVDNVEALGRELRCGTQCGSCIPELRALLAAHSTKVVA